MRLLLIAGINLLSLLFVVGCDETIKAPRQLTFELIRSTPHDPRASTQGFLLHEGGYYESTGGYNQSTLRKVDPATGRVLKRRNLPFTAFGEGLTLVDDKLYQLEWKSGKGFIYDLETFDRVGDFRYEGEGWGLAWDGSHFILSDGTATLRFLEPESFEVTDTVEVRDHIGPVDLLNELEFINGKVYANRWHEDEILVIDPDSGIIEATLNLAALERPRPRDTEAVLNGIAYNPTTRHLHVTGKLWTRVYLLKVND